MAYSINPNLPRARAIALKLLLIEGLPVAVVANRCGIHRTTVWRWKRKWDTLNLHVQLTNDNHPHRQSRNMFRLTACRWVIPTLSSGPHSHPHALSENVVRLVLETRERLKRCAEVVWYHLTQFGIVMEDGVKRTVSISLSSIKRIFKRHHVYDRKPKTHRRTWRPAISRPPASQPGALVETDTVHLYHPLTGKKHYLYTIIDLYSRMAYAELHTVLRPGLAAHAILKAEEYFGFRFTMVQSDNGPEFSAHFEDRLHGRGILTRHSRLHRPNDNAHIERFNRTIQEECTGSYVRTKESISVVQARLTAYLDYYNHKRVHLGIQMQTPVQMLQR